MINGRYSIREFLERWVFIDDSPTGAGRGCFAAQALSAGMFLGFYAGELINNRQARERYVRGNRTEGSDYLFEYDKEDRIFIDARVYGNHTRFVNHSCEPNCIYNKAWWPGDGVWRAGSFDEVYTRGEFRMPGLSAEYTGPNVYMIEMRTLREIKEGEELTCDYKRGQPDWIKKNCMCSKCRPLHE